MTTAAPALQALKTRRPEWTPWLEVVEEALRAVRDPVWDVAPARAKAQDRVTPLLSRAEVGIDLKAGLQLIDALLQRAAAGGSPQMATLEAFRASAADVLPLMTASLEHDRSRIAVIAQQHGADADALQAVVALLTLPLLQACQRHLAGDIPRSWTEPCCPACAAWPAFIEVRGIERTRVARCGRCGSAWAARLLQCPYCDLDDHEQLVTLVPEAEGTQQSVEACERCHRYTKVFTTLQGCAPESVLVEDLGSVALDVAAIDAGYERPEGLAHRLDVTVVARERPRRFLSWMS